MKLEEIHELWARESKIDKSNLLEESVRVPDLHAKWLKIWVDERLLMLRLTQEAAKLALSKHDWLSTGDTKESIELGWMMPPRGRPLVGDRKIVLAADNEMQSMELKVGLQKAKIEALDDILGHIRFRNNTIKNAIDMIKHNSGA